MFQKHLIRIIATIIFGKTDVKCKKGVKIIISKNLHHFFTTSMVFLDLVFDIRYIGPSKTTKSSLYIIRNPTHEEIRDPGPARG